MQVTTTTTTPRILCIYTLHFTLLVHVMQTFCMYASLVQGMDDSSALKLRAASKTKEKLDQPWSTGLIEAPKRLIPWSNCSSSISIAVNYHVNQVGVATVSLAAAFGAFNVLRCSRASLGAAAVVDAAGRGCWSSVGSAGSSNLIKRQAEAFPRLCRSYVVVNASVGRVRRRRTPRRQSDRGGSSPTVLCSQLSMN
jgi:hypothetical protein